MIDDAGLPLRKARVTIGSSTGTSLPSFQTFSGAAVGLNAGPPGSTVIMSGTVTRVGPPPPPGVPEAPPPPVTFTDNEGRFELAGLDAGRYTVAARKAGYVPTTYGARNPSEPPIAIDLNDGARVNVNIRMARSAGIAGRIADQFGEPIEGALVTAERLIRQEGRITARSAGTATTDDLGEYRIGALPASRYVVNAYVNRPTDGSFFTMEFAPGADPAAMREMMMQIPGMSQVRTYYPGVTGLVAAQPIELRTGEERTSADFGVPSNASFSTLTLSFFDADGKPIAADATLASMTSEIPRFVPVLARNPRISTRIEPGTWTVLARGNGVVGIGEVAAGSGDLNASVTLGKGGRIAGRVEADGSPLPVMRLAVSAVHPVDTSVISRWGNTAPTRADGTFEIGELLGPLVLRVLNPPKGWAVKSILFDGRDVFDAPIDFKPTTAISGVRVLMTGRTATLEGSATDAQGAALAEYSVLVFPEDRALAAHPRRYARWARPNQQGTFAIDDLLAGDYLAIAVTDVDDTQWQNADYLERFRAQATRVTLGESDKKRIVLPLIAP